MMCFCFNIFVAKPAKWSFTGIFNAIVAKPAKWSFTGIFNAILHHISSNSLFLCSKNEDFTLPFQLSFHCGILFP